MEPYIQELLSEACERPQHLKVSQWYTDYTDHAVRLWSDLYEWQIHESSRRKLKRRLEKWWHQPPDTVYSPPLDNGKLANAKRQRFTIEGKPERVSKSLAALSQPPRIQLTLDEWRQILEDQDMEGLV
jgi:hypothetical protein